MPRKYDNNFKSMFVNLIVNEKHSTIKTAQQFDIPLKTLEKWITSFYKDNHYFDPKLLLMIILKLLSLILIYLMMILKNLLKLSNTLYKNCLNYCQCPITAGTKENT